MIRITLIAIFSCTAVGSAQEPWLALEEQKQVRSMMPEGVPVPENLKFFRLPQKYQRLVVTNNVPTRTILPAIEQQHPWITSGGMHFADRRDWRNVAGLAIPEGQNIQWWIEGTWGGAGVPIPKVRWSFPKGTIAYDVLIRRDRWREHVFEVRTQEKLSRGWTAGVSYRPEIPVEYLLARNLRSWHDFRWQAGDDATTLTHRMEAFFNWYETDRIEPGTRFAPSKHVVIDGKFTPPSYVGTGVACAKCHDLVGVRSSYGVQVRGDDSRFSWHPFNLQNDIDYRWPIKRFGAQR